MSNDNVEREAILKRLATCDVSTLRRLACLLGRPAESSRHGQSGYLIQLGAVSDSDVAGLRTATESYSDSWKRRGGVDTFHMLTRKWDRIEKRVAKSAPSATLDASATPYDIFEHIAADRRADGLIDDVRDLRRYLMLIEAETIARTEQQVSDSGIGFLDYLERVARCDVDTIEEKEKAYGDSWKSRGGIAAFMILARKWDRIEQFVRARLDPSKGLPGASRDNIFEHIAADHRSEGILDDIRDLRRFLLLVEAEMVASGVVQIGTARDNRDEG